MKGTMGEKIPGLSRQHNGELNKFKVLQSTLPSGAPEMDLMTGRLNELRKQYRDDPVALRQIDQYDLNSEYTQVFKKFVKALHEGDLKTQQECEQWMKERGYE